MTPRFDRLKKIVPGIVLGFSAAVASAEPGHVFPPLTAAEKAAIESAVPAKAHAVPAKPRKLLVFYRTEGFVHASIPYGNEALRRMGEVTGAYTATVSDDMSEFDAAKLAQFDAVAFNSTTRLAFTDPVQRKALLDFVASGHGVIGIHAATDNFPTWPEGQALIGGLFHSHPWTAGDHESVKVDDPESVIVAPFEKKGFWINDEIYQIVGPYGRDRQHVVLSLDMSRPENARPAAKLARKDNDFPISWIKKVGDGRVFYSSLGHNKDIYYVPAILEHYLNGIQFALGDLSADATPSAALAKQPAAALAPDDRTTLQDVAEMNRVQGGAAPLSDPLAAIARFDYGQSRAPIVVLQTALRKMTPAERAAFEPRILALLGKKGLADPARQALIQCILLTGTPAAVPILEKLAAEESLSTDAARSLASIDSPLADAALVRLAEGGPAYGRITFVNALGQRRSAAALVALRRIAETEWDPLGKAALEAIAHYGTSDALAALASLDLTGPRGTERSQAILAAARTLLRLAPAPDAAASHQAAAGAARSVLASTKSEQLKIGAARILLEAAGEAAVAELLPLAKDPSVRVSQVVARSLVMSGSPAALSALNAAFGSLPAPVQGAVISAAYDAGGASMMPLVRTAIAGSDTEVRKIAARAAGRCGDESAVELLIPLLGSPETAAAAKDGLDQLPAGKVDAELLGQIAGNKLTPVGPRLLAVLADRQQRAALPIVLEFCRRDDAASRTAGFESIAKLVRAEDLPTLLTLAPAVRTAADRREWRKALFVAAELSGDGRGVDLIQAELARPDAKERAILIGSLSVIPGARSTDALHSMLGSSDPEVRKEVIRSLAAARSAGAFALLKEAAGKGKTPDEQILALRGFMDTIASLETLKVPEKVGAYREALALAQRQQEKDAVVAAVRELRGPEAEKFLKEFAPKAASAPKS